MSVVGVTMSTAACQVMGYAWYGPIFGSMWARTCGRRKEDMERAGRNRWIMLAPALSKVGSSFIIGHVLKDHLSVTTVKGAYQSGLVLSLILALYHACHAPFLGIGLPAFLVDVGFDTVCTVLTAVIVTRY